MNVQRPGAAQLNKPFDMIVIGGGINGSGIARDAAERGLDVLLLEKNDFGAGTTAYSSRLIHGGLRYLEGFELGLVRESLLERTRLLLNAPHLVRPLALGIPVYKHNKRPRWFIECGMILYDVLARLTGSAHVSWHRMYGKNGFLQKFRGVSPEGLVGGFQYFDAQVNLPERICVENAIAAQNHGAVVMNHTQVVDVLQENQKATGVRIQDLVTGEEHVAQGKVIVNAGGPWVDDVLKITRENLSRKIGGTKGTHIIVRRFDEGPNKALYVEAQSNQRPYFIIPWQKDYYLIGTTDDRYDGDLDQVIPTDDEIKYLVNETNLVLPKANLSPDDVLFSYAGIRPLPYADPDTPAGKITRKHIIFDHQKEGENVDQVLSIIGGKITTYRNLAEETVDYAAKRFGLKRSRCTTVNTPLPGGEGIKNINGFKEKEIPQAVIDYGVSKETADHLVNLYGSKFRNVLELGRENPDWLKPLSAQLPDIQAQVIYSVRYEFARSVADVLMRRTGSALRENVGLQAAKTTAQLIGSELDWSAEKIQAEASGFESLVTLLNRPNTKPVRLQ